MLTHYLYTTPFFFFFPLQDPAGIFELVEVVGNGTYGQVYKVCIKYVTYDRRESDDSLMFST